MHGIEANQRTPVQALRLVHAWNRDKPTDSCPGSHPAQSNQNGDEIEHVVSMNDAIVVQRDSQWHFLYICIQVTDLS